MARVLTLFLVVLISTVYCYGDQVVFLSIDSEDGMWRSDGDGGDETMIRVGAGESPDRTFINIMSFDISELNTLLNGDPITSAQLVLTCMTDYIWENPDPYPDQFGPSIDLSPAFNGDTAYEEADKYAPASLTDCHADTPPWGMSALEPGDTIAINLNSAAITAIANETSGKIQLRLNTGEASGNNDDAMDFYDGGNFLFSPLLIINPTGDISDPLSLIFNSGTLQPAGEYYEANVPDTLDLAERAKIALEGFTNIINWPDHDYAPYGHFMFNYNPPFATDYWGPGRHNWGKILEPLASMRQICGDPNKLDTESESWKGMINHIASVGCRHQRSRATMALMVLYENNHDPLLKDLIENMKQGFYTDITYVDDYAYYQDPPPQTGNDLVGIFNYIEQTHGHGSPINFLSQWYQEAGDASDLDLAGKISRFVRQPHIWEPETEPIFFTGAERAHFKGHVHSYLGALMGLLEYADTANEAWLKEFVRNGYEWIRNTGIARLGLFGETCIIGEMTILAAELSNAGVGDYWEDVDQYTRNHLTEMQVLDEDAMQAVIDYMPDQPVTNPTPDEDDNILSRCIGTFFTDGGHPTVIFAHNLRNTICCTGNGAKGMCYAWKNIVQCDQDGIAKINLLLNRASPWMDIDSYLPYEGKVVIRNKTANKISVRIPRWVDKSVVTCSVNSKSLPVVWVANYLDINRLRSGDVITIEFPMVETTETYTLKWKYGDWAWESNWAPTWWLPLPEPDQYTCYFRGNTLVDVFPRVSDLGYHLYQRDHLIGATVAPMKTVTRFVQSYDFASNACTDKPVGDLDGDCRVTLTDVTKIVSEWLHCGLADQEGCTE